MLETTGVCDLVAAFGITSLTLGMRLRGQRRHGAAAAGRHHRPVSV